MSSPRITSPEHPALVELCSKLAEMAAEMDRTEAWPTAQLRLSGEFGVFEWFLDPAWGGQGWDEESVVRGYLALSAACLTTTFIITQRTGACRRIAGSENTQLKERLLPGLASGELFATVGFSHLTTSRRHLARPVLTAERTADGFRLEGYSPWVTGGEAADAVVIGATMVENGSPKKEQILIAVPKGLRGVDVAKPARLIGVSASATGAVNFDGAVVPEEYLIAGPKHDVMSAGLGANTGGHETSTLAIGLAGAALDFLDGEAARRDDLQVPRDALRKEHAELTDDLLSLVRGEGSCTKELVRQRANSLVLRSAQAALTAAKGTGYVVGHPAGRWCREALFFLVWSCPQPVSLANLCELAGIAD
jgi:alkylation response protein AidB-like acyl-CoA dehydrogenase